MTNVQILMTKECPIPKSQWVIGHWFIVWSLVIGHWSFAGFAASPPALDPETATKLEALSRLKNVNLESNAALKGAVLKLLEKTRGTPQFVEIIQDFKLKGYGQPLLDYALDYPAETSGIEAFRLAVAELGKPALDPILTGDKAPALVQLIGNSNEKELQAILHQITEDPGKAPAVRKESVRALARTQDGARYLLDVAQNGKLGQDVKFAASSELNRAPWPEIKKRALELLPLPQGRNAEPLPPLADLFKRKGDPAHGKQIFESQTAGCSTCHKVLGKGGEVGPDLSEIGTKLGKDALYESILDPSAGISFGYEAWSLELKNGDDAFGLITSETAEELTLKNQAGIITKYKKPDIIKRQKSNTSIMPAGLQLTMSTQDLIDLIEYLSSLKKQ
jgi:putative heme-binding domain-containing protein